MKILVYGTIARAPSHVAAIKQSNWKARIKSMADRTLWRLGSTRRLDYRNYDLPYPTNVGDIAIAEATRQQLRSILENPTFVDVNWLDLENVATSVLSSCDLIVIAGSGYFHLANGKLSPRIARDFAVIEHCSIPTVLYGVGVNANIDAAHRDGVLISSEDADLLTRFLARTSHVGVRDRASQQLLAPYAAGKSVSLVGDPALFLDSAQHSQNQREVRQQGTGKPRVGINFSFHGKVPTDILRRNLPAYVSLLHTLRQESGCSLHYFMHNHSESIIPALLRDSGLPIETIFGEPDTLARRYAEMNIHLGGMLHSCILAVGAGTPCVLLPYDVKHRGFADLVGLEVHCHDATQLNAAAVLNSLRHLLAHEQDIRETIRGRLGVLRQEQESFLRGCCDQPRTHHLEKVGAAATPH